jgi:hypothetical protein
MCATVASWFECWWGMGIVGGHVFEGRLDRDLSGCSQISVVMMVTLQGPLVIQSLLVVVDNRCGSCLCSFEWVYMCE